ncbi:MAG: hypothetical protein ACLTMR_08570 [Faecalibacillus sp.]|nr:MAG TPA: hypothetical protein [Caudoviricetes sp.]
MKITDSNNELNAVIENNETKDLGYVFSTLELYLIIPAIGVTHRELNKFTTKEEVNQFISNKFFIVEGGKYYSIIISKYENMVVYILANADNKSDMTIVLQDTENQNQKGIQFIALNQTVASDLYDIYVKEMIDVYDKFNPEEEKKQ